MSDLMEDLAAAWDDAEVDNEPEDTAGDSEPPIESEAAVPEPDDDVSASAEAAPEPSEGEPEPAPEPQEDPVVDEAPSSLPPAAREAWKDVPDSVKAAVAKREKDYEAGIMKYAEQAKRAEGMDRLLQPFQQYFAMNGGPGPTIQSLLQTGATLQMGSPQQRAQAVAGIIKQFGVDIQTLDHLLVGEAPPEPQASVPPEVQNELQQMRQFMGQFQQQQQYEQQASQQRIASEVEQFSTANEFYDDVKMDMADLMDMAAKRGQGMTLQEAYDKACAMNPEISQIIQGRNNAQSVEKKRAAAASVTGGPGGNPSQAAPDSLRDTIANAWDMQGRM